MDIAQHLLWTLQIGLVSAIIGIISWPITALIFQKTPLKGYIFAKIIGWIAITYLVFTLVTIKIIPLTVPAIIGVAIVWATMNGYIQYKKRPIIINKSTIKKLIITEVVIGVLLLVFMTLKAKGPEIYQIERFMDFGFIKALENTKTLPVHDIWYAKESLNYYYFGHMMAYTMIELTGLTVIVGFFAVQSLVFTLLSAAVASLGYTIMVKQKKVEKKQAITAGIISTIAVVFSGTWNSWEWIRQYVQSWWHNGQIQGTEWFYADPTRIMPGTITEMPFYSFLIADLHGHVWGLLVGVIVIAAIMTIDATEKREPWNVPQIWLIITMLGIAYMTNTWDVLTLGSVFGITVLLTFKKLPIWKRLLTIAAAGIVAYAIALPWSATFHPPVSGIGIVKEHATLYQWIMVWGSVIAFPLAYVVIKGKKEKRIERLVAIAFIWIVAIEIFHIKDIKSDTIWFRADTVFKVTTQVWLWLGIISGPIIMTLLQKVKKGSWGIVVSLLIAVALTLQFSYPIIATSQALGANSWTGIDKGLLWWERGFKNDYEAYLFLEEEQQQRKKTTKEVPVIIEAEGDSYTDISRFSVFLGWPTVVGWPVHEWTWRGSYDEVGARRDQVREVYLGIEQEETQKILEEYNVEYIIIGEVERTMYGAGIEIEKLKKTREVVFQNEKTTIIRVQ